MLCCTGGRYRAIMALLFQLGKIKCAVMKETETENLYKSNNLKKNMLLLGFELASLISDPATIHHGHHDYDVSKQNYYIYNKFHTGRRD